MMLNTIQRNTGSRSDELSRDIVIIFFPYLAQTRLSDWTILSRGVFIYHMQTRSKGDLTKLYPREGMNFPNSKQRVYE